MTVTIPRLPPPEGREMVMEPVYLANKECDRCGDPVLDDYYTLQITGGEPLKETLAEEDCRLCLCCRLELHQWLEAKNTSY